MAKGKMPPQLLEYFKNKNKKKEDGSGEKMSDKEKRKEALEKARDCLLYTSPSPRDTLLSRMPSSA